MDSTISLDIFQKEIVYKNLVISNLEKQLLNNQSCYYSKQKYLLLYIIKLKKQLEIEREVFEMKLKHYRNQFLLLKRKIFTSDSLPPKQTKHFVQDGFRSRFEDMCTLQESEHKISVNGQDINNLTCDEGVQTSKNESDSSITRSPKRIILPGPVVSTKSCSNNNNISKMKTSSCKNGSDMVTIATQTDEIIEDELLQMLDPQLAAYEMFAFNGHGTFAQAVDFGLTELELADGLEFYDQPFDIVYREITLERASVEEKVGLTLCYENHDAAEDEITDIYVSEIEPDSIAARCGDIREGDQILQINGVEVKSRADAIQLFSENRADITLLIARPVYQVDDGFMDDRGDFDDDFRLVDQEHRRDFTETYSGQGEECASTDTVSTEKSRNDKDSGVGRTDDSTKNEESSEQDVECTSPGHNKDPDHHCSNDSFTSNETQENEHLTTEQLLRECNKFREALETRCDQGEGVSNLLRIDSQSSIEREIDALNKEMAQIQIECQQIYEAHKKDPQKIKVKTDSVSSSGGDTFKSGSPSRSVPRMGTRLEYIRQLNALQHDGAVDPVWVRHEQCTNMGSLIQRYNHSHPTNIILPLDSGSSSNINPSNPSHNNIPFPNGQLSNGVKDDCSTTSAYYTGDSCRSTPLTLELTHIQNDKGQKQPLLSLSVASNLKSNDKQKSNVVVNGHHSQHDSGVVEGDYKDIVNGSDSVSRTSQTPEPPAVDNLQDLYSQYAEVMYTNQANLQHTMMVQQRLFQQKMLQQQTESKSNEGSPKHNADVVNASPKHSNIVPAPFNSSPKHMTLLANPGVNGSLAAGGGGGGESSGANNSGVQMEWVVKRRADGTRYITRRPMRSKFLKERAKKISEERSGMTTDDDAMSELKFGRYWTKEDRKRHLEKAKEYKRRKQEMFRKKMETLKEIEEKKKEPNILELSHRKMMKHKNKKAFDDFTTVQEMLVHGSRGQKAGVETSPSKTASANPLLSVTTV